MKSFKTMLRAHVNEHPEHWLQSVAVVRMQYWSRLHSVVGVSVHEMVFGRRPNRAVPFAQACTAAAAQLPVVAVVPDDCAAPSLHVARLQEQHFQRDADAFERIQEQFQRNAAHWPSRLDNVRPRLRGQHLSTGDWILEIVPGPVKALCSGVKGPFLVVDFIGPDRQVAVLETGATEFKDKCRFRRHVRNLARYFSKHHLRVP